jgi:hypothetical protein
MSTLLTLQLTGIRRSVARNILLLPLRLAALPLLSSPF